MPRRNRNGRGSPGNRGHRPSRKEIRKQKRNAERSQEEKLAKLAQEEGRPSPTGERRNFSHSGGGSTKYRSSLAGPTMRDPEDLREYFRSLNPSRKKAYHEEGSSSSSYQDSRRSSFSPKRSSQDLDPHKKFAEGRVDIHPDGFGFLIPFDPKLPNIYVTEESLRYVMHRDEVRVQITHQFQGGDKTRGQVVDILKRHQKELLGIFRPYKGGALVIPMENRDRKHAFKVSGQAPHIPELKSGAAVLCRIEEYPDKGTGVVFVENTFTDPTAPSMDTLKVLMEVAWPREHSKKAHEEAEKRAHDWKRELAHEKRVDLRELPLVTIDGKDARDFDDAVYARFEGKNIRLWVAIADVSHFVHADTQLDQEAFERATSVYFPDHVVPMLPEVLSNGVCSLNPFEDRACLFVEMTVNPQGKISDWEFHEGLMRSHHRLTYEQMQAFIEGQDWALTELLKVSENLEALIECFYRLNKARVARGSIDLDIAEAQVILKPTGEVLDMQPRTRLDAHRLIEECMLAANECAAKFLHDIRGEGVYRIHEAPDPAKVDTLLDFISKAGLDLGIKKSKSKKKGKVEPAFHLEESGDFADMLERLKQTLPPDDPTLKAIQSLVLRSLKQAKYSSERVGHFALATKDYTHFTSPIRRYPDLIVHRLIRDYLRHPGSNRTLKHGWATSLEEAAQHCSTRERTAMEAERKLIDIKKCRYLETKLGEEFDAWVTSIIEKGIFCQLDGHFVDGLLSADILHRRLRLRYDAESMSYVGPGKTKISLGTRLRVQVAAVSIENRRIDFDLVEVLKAP